MPAGLWGRAESVRTLLRTLGQALAPLLFGAVADLVAGITPHQQPIGTKVHGSITTGTSNGLEYSFLVMLVVLAAAGVILLRARLTYPRDVATAAASSEPTAVADNAPPPSEAATQDQGDYLPRTAPPS
jgi:hypothetical protein